jgi:signal transduction histidine kinase/CheY-like chemotaxis protein
MLWLGTQSGLFRFDPKTEKSKQYTVRDGLSENAIMCALADDLGNIWMSTFQRGMSRLNLKEGRFYNYDAIDGLQGNMYTSGSCYRARDGRLYFGGRAGFNAFVPREVLAGVTARPAVITDFQVNGRKVGDSGQAIWETDALHLSAEQKVFAFEFASLCYFHPRKTRYRFRLDGLEKEWTEADSGHRFARYTGIAPGNYAFRVQASLDGRTWSGQESAIRLTLPPPWWNSGWSRSAGLLTILTLIFGAHKLRVKRFELRERRLRKIVEERTSELEQARDQAEAASHAKSSFLANMSHELRTPLNAILGFSTLLREDATSEKQRQDLEIINRSGEHLLNLINDVLDVAKIEAGRQELDLTPCDLLDLVNEVTEMMGPRAGEKKLALLCVAPHDFPRYVWADAPKLRQVFINLLSNALKYTHEGRVILRLQGTEADEPGQLRLTFEVEDSGIGIAKEDHARIFDAFVQVHNRNGQKGSGLGLTITRKFVELMGGSIEVESTEGQGSIFRVKLPALAAKEPEVKTIADDAGRIAGVEAGQPVYRILVVDDEIENRLMLERILQEAGFQVRVAEDGAQGVEAFEEWRPDFIWMDVRMPVMDGIEATRRIRKLEGGGAVKIAAITASAYASERDIVMIAGMDDFLLKPYRRREILGCLARHLGVRYVYHDEAAAADEAKLLEALPETLRVDLTEALISLDGERITHTIGRIAEFDATLGERLTRRATRLSYTSILHDLGCLEAASAGSSG